MTKEKMTDLYCTIGNTIEAFMEVEVDHEVWHNVEVEGDSVPMDFYKVTFNPHELLTVSDLTEIRSLLKTILENNGVDTDSLKIGGRKTQDLDFSEMNLHHKPTVDIA